MGVLYYVAKLDDSREVFALNKLYGREEVFQRLQGEPLRTVFAEEPDLSGALFDSFKRHTKKEDYASWSDWFNRVAARLFKWAGSAPLDFISEFTLEEFHGGLDYGQSRTLITGSAHDSDYEEDGVTYKVGSAW